MLDGSKEVVMVMKPPVKRKRIRGSCDRVLRIAFLLLLLDEPKVVAPSDEVLVSPHLGRVTGLILIIGDGCFIRATEKRLSHGGIRGGGLFAGLARLAFKPCLMKP